MLIGYQFYLQYNGFALQGRAFIARNSKKSRWRKYTHLLNFAQAALAHLFISRDKTFIIDPNDRSYTALASILSMPYAMLSGAFTGPKMGYNTF
jgi:hypothetical protein